MSATKTEPTNGAATTNESNGRNLNSEGIDALIGQAESLKRSLRDAGAKTGELITTLKRHTKHANAVRSTLASLRQRQTLEV